MQLFVPVNGPWTPQVGPSINPVSPDGYAAVQTTGGLRLYCVGAPYAGWLAKAVTSIAPLALNVFPAVTLNYVLTIDDATNEYAQVVETDTKITDAEGNTFDCSGQWNIAEAWRFQVGNPWVNTGVIEVPAPVSNIPFPVSIEYAIDYARLTSTVVSVNGVATGASPIPAKKMGWAPSQIVTQLQQCIAGQRSAYSISFQNVGYVLSV